MTEWRTIDTAPKDMTPILCVCMKASPEFEQHIGYMAVDCWFNQSHGYSQFN